MTTFFDTETTGLSPFTSQLVTVQVRREGKTTVWRVWETSEVEIAEGLLKYFDSLPWSETVVGYNVMGFDLPFVSIRLWLNLRMNETVHERLYRKKWFDLYHYFGADFRSADFWLARFGINRTCAYTGKDMPALYQRKEYGKIEEHAVEDLTLCEALYNKLGTQVRQV